MNSIRNCLIRPMYFIGLGVCVLLFGARVQGQEPDLIKRLKVLDALFEEANEKLKFCSEFTYESAVGKDFNEEQIDEFFADQDRFVERMQGQLLIGTDAMRYKCDLVTPFKMVEFTTGEISSEYAQAGVQFLSYTPRQVAETGEIIAESIQLEPIRPGVRWIRSGARMHCPIFGQWFRDGLLFGRYTELPPKHFEIERIDYLGIERQVLVVRGNIGDEPNPINITWIIDDNAEYPVLLEYHLLDTKTKFTKIKKLKNGIRIPTESISLSKSQEVGGEEIVVRRWRYTKFEERVPEPHEFAINFTEEVRAIGLEIPQGTTSINILDLKKGDK
jgi:hypothetical protein